MKLKDIFQYCLAVVVMVGFLTLIFLLFNKSIPAENKDVAYVAVGTLGTAFGLVLNYFFGSTKGSAEKTEIISKLPPVQDEKK